MKNTYRIRYEQKGTDKLLVADRSAVSPISALNQFHREMQKVKGFDWKSYRIVELAILYNSDATGNCRGEWIESTFQLPSSPTPDLREVKEAKPAATEPMEFLAATEGQGRLAE